MQSVRIFEMPACKMVSSGIGMFGEGNFVIFDEWLSSQKRSLFPKDFLYWAGEGFLAISEAKNPCDVDFIHKSVPK